MECPECGEPEMVFYPGEEWVEEDVVCQEPDMYGCPDCGHEEVL